MRTLLVAALALIVLAGMTRAEEPLKSAPKVVLKSPDGKKTYDLDKLTVKGPVLVRLTCACSGCDQELPYFQKLQAAYNGKGLQTLAAFKEKPEATADYAVKKDLKFLWVADPEGKLWNTFETKTMPTNILIDKGGKVVKVVRGCTKDGKNAQILSAEVAKLLKTEVAAIADSTAAKK
jgi:peroxiredoxin